jgi:hypothetical protein
VDEEQVDVVEPEPFERPAEGPPRVVRPMTIVRQLGGDEHVRALQSGPRDRRPDLLLVAVHLGRIDMPVTGFERRRHGPLGVRRLHQEHAEA